jgi:hypothetical protein
MEYTRNNVIALPGALIPAMAGSQEKYPWMAKQFAGMTLGCHRSFA